MQEVAQGLQVKTEMVALRQHLYKLFFARDIQCSLFIFRSTICFFLSCQIDDGSGMKREATVDDLVKMTEELTRIH